METQGRGGGGGGRPNHQNQRGGRGGRSYNNTDQNLGNRSGEFWGSGNGDQRVGPTGGGGGGRRRGSGQEYQRGRGRGYGGYGDGNQLMGESGDGGFSSRGGRGRGGQNQFVGGYGNSDQNNYGGAGRGNGGQNQFGDQSYYGGGGRGNTYRGQNQVGGQRRSPGVADGGRGNAYQGQSGGYGSGNQRNPGGGGGGGGRGYSDQNQFGGNGAQRRFPSAPGGGDGSGENASQGSHHAQLDPLTPNFLSMRLSPAKSSISEGGKYLPIKRPDNGGTASTQRPQLFVNHFPVGFNPKQTIFHYDVEIKLQAQPRNGKKFEILKSDMRAITKKFFSDSQAQFLSKTAYDGEKNVFSALELPQGTFTLELSKAEGLKGKTYEFTIKLVKKLELQRLEDYLKGRLQQIPREILQGMDVVMKENPTRHWMSIGKGFYSRDHSRDVDIGGGIIAAKGFQHSLKLTSQDLVLCVDYSVLPLRKPIPVKQFIEESLNIKIDGTRTRTIATWEWRKIENALKGLKVSVTHRRTKQQYKIEGLTKKITKELSFTLEDVEDSANSREVGLVEYFRTNYGKEIEYQYLPSLDFSKSRRINWVPIEFCELVEGQRYPKENLDKYAAKTLKNECLAEPRKRMEVICDFVNERNGPCGGDIAENFDISVRKEMTQVIGRVIGPPGLRLGESKGKRFMPNRDNGQWNLRSVLEGKHMDRWAVLDFTSCERDSRDRLNPHVFIDHLMDRLTRLGMRVNPPLLCEASNMNVMSHPAGLGDLLRRVTQQAEARGNGRLQILICVMARKDPGYKNLKRISETEIGVMTQCCLVEHANNCKEIFLGNLGLKLNAKLGGTNAELFDRLPHFKEDDHVMFIGADVNHPGSWNVTSPSIAAVVATTNWPAANRYVARISPQEHRKEEIQNFGGICLDLVNMYSRLNNVRPQRIVVFRDGVADNQFDMVLNQELIDLKNTICSGGYCPTITLVVCQKRHQTRFFPKNTTDPRNKNALPGTVVDTDVVHPDDFDFYFFTHYGGIGTSKPTHYTVLYDDHGFTSDEMQRLIYNLCYTFARCTKPVSLVPPVYYADLVAYRGRLYYDAIAESSPGSSSSSSALSPSSSSGSSLSLGSGFDYRTFKLHGELENSMFFC